MASTASISGFLRTAKPLLTQTMVPVWLFGFLLTLDAILTNGFGPAQRLRTIVSLAVLFSAGLIYVLGWLDDPVALINRGVAGIFALAITSYLVANHFFPPPHIYSGPLLEAGENSPASVCGNKVRISRGDLGLYFGHDEVVGKGAGPVGPVMVGACSAVKLTRNGRGLLVDAFAYDSFGNIAWRIYRNNFTLMSGAFVTPDGYHFGQFITPDRTDKSALRLVDDEGHEIFAVRYLNRNAVQISSALDCGTYETAESILARRLGSAGLSCSIAASQAEP